MSAISIRSVNVYLGLVVQRVSRPGYSVRRMGIRRDICTPDSISSQDIRSIKKGSS
jgi:hypothetical protein